jgi:hypothetical protein
VNAILVEIVPLHDLKKEITRQEDFGPTAEWPYSKTPGCEAEEQNQSASNEQSALRDPAFRVYL